MGEVADEVLTQRADEIFAQRVEERITAATGNSENVGASPNEKVWLLQFRSHPHEFADALGRGGPLRTCIDALADDGHDYVLPSSNAKVFVKPHQWREVTSRLSERDLRPYHVVVSESYEQLVYESLRNIRFKRRPTLKEERTLLLTHEPNSRVDQPDVFQNLFSDWTLDVKHSFLCAVPRVHDSSAVTQSTTQHYEDPANGPRNPRRRDPMAHSRGTSTTPV